MRQARMPETTTWPALTWRGKQPPLTCAKNSTRLNWFSTLTAIGKGTNGGFIVVHIKRKAKVMKATGNNPGIAYNLDFEPVEDDRIVREIDFKWGLLHCTAYGGWESVTEAKEHIFSQLLVEVFDIFSITDPVEVTIDTLLYSDDIVEAYIQVVIKPLTDDLSDVPF